MSRICWMPTIQIAGYRPFNEVRLRFQRLQVIVGANGSGKSSLFEFLKFLRDACHGEIPPEIAMGSIGQQIFHKPGSDKLGWIAEFNMKEQAPLFYKGELMGPVGAVKINCESVATEEHPHGGSDGGYTFLDFKNGEGRVKDPGDGEFKRKKWNLEKPNQLGLGAISDSSLSTLFKLREQIRGWRFYSAFNFNNDRIRSSAPVSQDPVLNEDARNLSAVLFNLMTEHPRAFEELKSALRAAIPGFRDLNVKARGGPGEVISFWREENIDTDLTLSDLSDGALRMIAWSALCVSPSPPSLICIDEPDLGLHPRTLPILAGLFEKASERTQMVLATHASGFLTQFELDRIAVMKRRLGESHYIRVKDSQTLLDNLKDFGVEELELMHRTDELEALS